MRKDDPQINLRIPPELKDQVQQAAKENRRTQTAEIIARLQVSFADETPVKRINRLEARIFQLERFLMKKHPDEFESENKGEG